MNHHVPSAVLTYCRLLPPALADILYSVWLKHWKRHFSRQVVIGNVDQYTNLVSWHAKKLDKLNDEWFIKIAKHVSNIEHYPEIDAALKLHLNDDYEQLKRYIGHLIFAKVPDATIAKQWSMPIKVITALRMLFFDFGALPKDPVAQWATLVQWVNNGDIKPEEFSLYKRVHELGPLGLKAQVAGSFLDSGERLQVKDYLTKSATTNLFNINFATRTPRDALIYNRVIGDLIRLDLQHEELKVRQCEQRLLEMQVQKLGKEMNTEAAPELQSEDLKLIQSAINVLAKQDSNPRYRTIFELTKMK